MCVVREASDACCVVVEAVLMELVEDGANPSGSEPIDTEQASRDYQNPPPFVTVHSHMDRKQHVSL
jgi:hypothetical protein